MSANAIFRWSGRNALVPLVLALEIALPSRPACATLYNRTTGAGAFRQSTLWSPYFPPTFAGPGDADDVVRFNLGTPPGSRYTVTNVQGENDRLLVGNDALTLNIEQYSLTNYSGTETSLTMGLADQDQAYLTLTGTTASHLQSHSMKLGAVSNSTGTLRVQNIRWESMGQATIGNFGGGFLQIADGAQVTQGGQMWVGNINGSSGGISVTGPGTSYTVGSETIIGDGGNGYLNVNGGASMTSWTVTLGERVNSHGSASANGAGTSWTNTTELVVGAHGVGAIFVDSGANVSSARSAVGVYADGSGAVTVRNPGSTWTTAGTLSIGGDSFTGQTQGHGVVTVKTGGKAYAGGTTTIYAGGTLDLQGGSFVTPTIALQGGAFNWTGGALSVGVINANLTNENGILVPGDLSPANSTGSSTIAGNYTQLANGTLAIDIGGTAAGATYDSVGVTGSAILGGQLELSLANGFAPHGADTFSVFNAVGGVLGVFSNVGSGQRLTLENGAGSFLVSYGLTSPYNPNQIVLSDFLPTFSADFDLDGDVDGDDLVQWQGDFGLNGSSDADGDNDSDGADFLAWQRQLGSGVPSAAIAAAVPEPGAACLAVVAALGLAAKSKRFGRVGR
jgi:T5SS/PEP-CTERM-associated repeat protein